jgi:hypothetical protein
MMVMKAMQSIRGCVRTTNRGVPLAIRGRRPNAKAASRRMERGNLSEYFVPQLPAMAAPRVANGRLTDLTVSSAANATIESGAKRSQG